MGGAEGSTLRERLASFSIVSGGLLWKLLHASRLGGLSRRQVARRCVVLMALAWVPLLVATAAEGTALGGLGSFAWDVGTHVRLLLALPLLLTAERALDRRVGEGLGHLVEAGLVSGEDGPRVDRVLAVARRARDSHLVEVALLAVVVALSVSDVVDPPTTPHWMFAAGPGGTPTPTVAGWIEVVLSAPLYRLLLLRWVWRWVVWVVVLLGFARTGLRISALHVDEVGGLSVLSDVHTSFGWVLAALGATLAGNFTGERMLLGGSVADYTHTIAVFCVIAPMICLAPMLAFTWPLELARRRAHRDYSVVAADFARRYARVHLEPAVPIGIGSSDPSSAEDLGGSYERMRATRPLAVERKQFFFLFACAFAPMVPFYLQQLPLAEIVERLLKMLG